MWRPVGPKQLWFPPSQAHHLPDSTVDALILQSGQHN